MDVKGRVERNDTTELGAFIGRYGFWVLVLFVFDAVVWVLTASLYGSVLNVEQRQGDLWSIRMYVASGLLLFDNLCVLWWYADSARRQTVATENQLEAAQRQLRAAEQQMEMTNQQLALAQREYHDSWLERWQDNKPIVFTEWNERGNLQLRNVGGGLAVNVYVLIVDRELRHRFEPAGAVGAGQSVEVRGGAEVLVRSAGGSGHIAIAEGVATRTRRWNPTLNWTSGGATEHRLVYPVADAETLDDARREAAINIDEYVEVHGTTLFEKLAERRSA